MTRRQWLVAMLLAGLGGSARAQTAPPIRVRGTIAAVSGNTLSVKTREGPTLNIVLAGDAKLSSVKAVDLGSVAAGSYIGTATRTGADGKLTALEVLILPEEMRGAGEGQYPWDLEPGSMMTNGTVKGVTAGAAGRELTIGFKDSSNTVFVPPGVPVVTFAPASSEDLKAGAPVYLVARKAVDGTLTTPRVVVGKDGVAPPM